MNPPGELVRQYGEGDSFGELAILYNAPRAATCIATSPVVRLWALDRVSFKLILVKNSLAKQAEYTKFLKQVSIFAQLTECELLTVADALEEKVFSENEVVCAQGDVGDSFYIIVDGIAVCSIQDASGSVKEVARLSKGSYFGEVSDLFPSKMLNVS
jgi:cAMP-dependent protein kinase regulator